MIDELMTIYATRPTLNLPPVPLAQSAANALPQRGSQLAAQSALAQ
jgi:hypothetical protein